MLDVKCTHIITFSIDLPVEFYHGYFIIADLIIMINIICYVNVIFFLNLCLKVDLILFIFIFQIFLKYIFNIIVEFYCWSYVCDTLKLVIIRFSMSFFLHYKHVMKFFKNLVRVFSGINSLHSQFGTKYGVLQCLKYISMCSCLL